MHSQQFVSKYFLIQKFSFYQFRFVCWIKKCKYSIAIYFESTASKVLKYIKFEFNVLHKQSLIKDLFYSKREKENEGEREETREREGTRERIKIEREREIKICVCVCVCEREIYIKMCVREREER